MAVDGGDLSVTASAAHTSTYGLQALIDDTVILKAVDTTHPALYAGASNGSGQYSPPLNLPIADFM